MILSHFVRAGVALLAVSGLWSAAPGMAKQPPSMAPLNAYLMPTSAEIALARSAAPPVVSAHASVLVLQANGYHRVVNGTNGFVCLVFRSWTAGRDDPDFWSPEIRSPLCLNAPAASTYLPLMEMRTKLILAGKSKAAAFAAVSSALQSGRLQGIAAGAMSYMLSKSQYVATGAKNWHPHLMFFISGTTSPTWGANAAGSPVIESVDVDDRLTIFLVPVSRWSDGSVAPPFP